MESTAVGLIVVAVVWLAWRTWAKHCAAQKDHAWNIVLKEPDNNHRRRYEERLRDYKEQARKGTKNPYRRTAAYFSCTRLR